MEVDGGSAYSVTSRISRLIYAGRVLGDAHPAEALKKLTTALQLVKSHTFNTDLYDVLKNDALKVYSSAIEKGIALPDVNLAEFEEDTTWLKHANISFHDQLERLTTEFEVKKRSLVRQKIREGAMALGELCFKRGDFNAALLRYLNAKENSSRIEEIEVSWMIVLASVYMESMTHVSNAASRVLAMKEIAELPEYAARFNVALGMLQLKASNYHKAVEYFFHAAIQGPANIEEVDFAFVTWKDVAVYAGIAALGSFGRQELKTRILDDPIARKTFEAVPWLKNCISKFYQTKYSVALQALEEHNEIAIQDRYLGAHWKRLLRRIRSRAISQYTAPFSSVDLRAMAAAFQMELGEFEKELAELIQDGEINFRIDSGSKVLWENSINPRIRAFNHALRVGDDFTFHAKLTLLKVHLQKNQILVGKEEGFSLRARQVNERKDFE